MSFAFAQEASPSAAASPEMSADKKAEMEAWMKSANPGAEHKALEFQIGTWDAVSKFFMDPGQPPKEDKASATNEWALGERFIQTRYSGIAMGQPFDGIGFLGYDNVEKQYVSTWMDSMTTGIFIQKGQMSPDGKVLTQTGEMKNPRTGKMGRMKSVTTKISADEHMFEMYDIDDKGNEQRSMEIHYTRKK